MYMRKSMFSGVAALAFAASFLLIACSEVLESAESGEETVAENEIAQINLSGVVSPVKGGVPLTELVVLETADYTVGAIEWQNAQTGEVLSSEEKFEADVSYRAIVPLTAKEGKNFTESSKVAIGQSQIGDSESEIESCEITLVSTKGLRSVDSVEVEEAILTITYKATPVKPAIKSMRANKAYVVGLRVPAIGETPRNLSLDPDNADDDGYDENKSGVLYAPFTAGGITVVYDPSKTKWLNADKVFVAGKEYKAQITLQAGADRVFGDKLDVLFGYNKVTKNYTSSDLEDNQVFAQKESSVSLDRKTTTVVLTFKALQATE
ncbi:MAG: hypothetical protein Ta2G_06420 [Termitinemataceae bacterium]|nr:MAG: hypothetical protein Ta2G_06420 [Termitinemataceae bacterium]